jgi:hypothetical protein
MAIDRLEKAAAPANPPDVSLQYAQKQHGRDKPGHDDKRDEGEKDQRE